MAVNKQTNKQTENLNRTVKVLNLLIYRAPPTVHFHRIVHSFKEGRFLIDPDQFFEVKVEFTGRGFLKP